MKIVSVANMSKDIVNGSSKLHILKNINLTIHDKEYVAVMGASGSGKSTMISIIGGLDSPSSGTVEVVGKDIFKLSENKIAEFRNQYIGTVFQSFNLIPSLTALENIEIPMLFSKKKYKVRERAIELLEVIGLKEKIKTFPRQLSGGEQQRVAIVRALATEPKLLIADEPTGSLDKKNGEIVMKIFDKFRKDYDMAILLATHDQNIANMADRIVRLNDGVLEVTSPND